MWYETSGRLMATAGFQVHQLQPYDDPTVVNSQQMRQGSRRLRRHVFHFFPGFRSARISALRHSV